MSEEEKIYQFNEYVLGYDKGLNDRSCLTISKIQNDNIYVMTTLTDGSAEVVSMILDNLQAENKRLNNIINELGKCIKDKYYEAIDYQAKIRQSDLMQGSYPVRYYLEEQNEQLCNYFLNRLKDLQEFKGVDKE